MDALSDVLKSVRLEGAVYRDAEFSAPWCIQAKYGLETASAQLAGAEHIMFFHFLIEGHCKVRLAAGGEVLDASAGDLILLPQDDTHIMGSDLQLQAVATDALVEAAARAQGGLVPLRAGGGGSITRFVCGYVACSRSICRPLFEALPRALRIPIGDGSASTALRELLRMGVRESSGVRPGSGSLLAKLSELMLVEALRRYVESLPPDGKGWLAGVRDVQIGRALALLHHDPGRSWTVDELAREVALSRSALAERFNALVGEPPIQYLMRWRLALAAHMLRSGRDAIVRVAERSGYESEAAFNRAFKREFGMPPAGWRRAVAQ
ncbi:MAG TPA: AraC family transcriptional regulator [Rudaea sp.]|jgi:AraC-like DNA-binding protein